MIVVLDSSVLCQNLRLAGSASRVFFGNLGIVPATVLIPEVVVDEVVNFLREQLVAAQDATVQANRRLSQLLSGTRRPMEPVAVDQEVSDYKQYLLKRLSDAGGRTIPYPKTPHDKIVQRALQRRKPFKHKGSGYRDFLVWESVRAQAFGGHEHIAFATANTSDFASGIHLHQDLSRDILNPQRVEIFTSLQAFNEKHILPRLETVERFDDDLRHATGGKPKVTDWIRKNLLNILRDEDFGYWAADLPPGVGSFWPREIVTFDAMEVRSTRKLRDDELACEIEVGVSVETHIDIDDEDYDNHKEVREWLDGTGTGSWYEIFEVRVILDVTLNAEGLEVTSHDVRGIERV